VEQPKQTTFDRVKQYYADEAERQQTLNALICGDSGSGKTSLLRTCRRPILVHSFDPGGNKGLHPRGVDVRGHSL
jgi:ABC-type phosphate transport system ATPase subunit